MADIDSFTIISKSTSGGHVYAKDKNSVYVEGNRILVDSGSFELLGKGKYMADVNSVYFESYDSDIGIVVEKIENADRNSFQLVGKDGYAKDQNSVYYNGQKVGNADADTFNIHILYKAYATDQNSAYYRGQKIKNVDIETFYAFSYRYSRDKNAIYYRRTKNI